MFRIDVERAMTLNLRLAQPLPGTRLLLFGDCGAPSLQCGGEFGDLTRRVAPGTYYVAVDGANEGDILLEMDPPPGGGPGRAGEACAEAQVLMPGIHQVSVTADSPNDFRGGCILDASPDQAFRIDVPAESTLSVALTEEAATASVLLFQDCDGPSIACSGDSPSVSSIVDAGAYYLVIDGQYNGGLRVELDPVGGPAAPVMENFCGPAAVGTPVQRGTEYTFVDSTNGSGNDLDAAACQAGFLGGATDKLFIFELQEAGRVRATLEADFPATLLLYADDCFADPICSDAAGQPSLDQQLPIGTYILGVDGQGPEDNGDFTLNFAVE